MIDVGGHHPDPALHDTSSRRAHLDGVRAVAVYLVVAFHAGLARFGGGHIGVDVFFVLSGYLVTGVLLRDLGDGSGRVRFGRFYARRARRLLPAALICLVLTALAFHLLASPVEVAEHRRGFQAAAVYLTNWYLIDNATSYFAADTAHSPVLHFWSLAVEEQFYLLWPLLLSGLVLVARRAGRHRWHVLRGAFLLGALASMTWAFALRGTDPNRAYYGTDTRAYQLLLGGLLALSPFVVDRLRRLGKVNAVLALAGIAVLVGVSVIDHGHGPIPRGIAAAGATVALLAALETGRGGWTARALSWEPVAFLGRISYGTYLWHWPVIVLLRLRVPELSASAVAVVAGLLATGLAALSYDLLEHPIRTARRLDRVAWPVAISGLAMSVIAGAVALPRALEVRRVASAATVRTGEIRYTPVPTNFDSGATWGDGFGSIGPCGAPGQTCTRVEGTKGTIVLMGDSNAQMWIPAFEGAARELDLRLVVLGDDGCLWQDGLYFQSAEVNATCRRVRGQVYGGTLESLHPDALFVVNARWYRPTLGYDPSVERDVQLRDATRASVEDLRAWTDNLVIIEHAPRSLDLELDPLKCLATEEVIEACRFVAPDQPDWLELEYRRLADATDGVETMDLDRLVCPYAPICDAMVDGVPVFWNASHITRQWSASLGPALADHLRANRLVPT